MAATTSDIEAFLNGPLVKWLSTCIKKPQTLQIYETFFDGAPINEVLLQIDPEASLTPSNNLNTSNSNITAIRVNIFHTIIRNIKSIYEHELGQIIVSQPDCVTLGRTPGSLAALEQLKLLILLLLGCAVQGPTKEIFIQRIKELDVDSQHDIVECIRQITDGQNVVLTLDYQEQPPERLFAHLKSLTSERDKFIEVWINDLSRNESPPISPVTGGVVSPSKSKLLGGSAGNDGNTGGGVESNHYAVELADWKAKLRKLRQELEEKTEILTECREELEHATGVVAKLRAENAELVTEARRAKAYRDEVDAMRERAERADKLEGEVQRYRERLADAEFYRVRVEELREDNRVLVETREMLEMQVVKMRQRADHVMELEAELVALKQSVNEAVVERDTARERIQELVEENVHLQQITKSALRETSKNECTAATNDTSMTDVNLDEQLTSNAQTRALKLELENKRLQNVIDSMREDSFHEQSIHLIDVEKEKKKLSIKCEQLQTNCDQLTRQNNEFETLFRNALLENRKLHETLDAVKMTCERQSQDIQSEKSRIVDLERNIDALNKEKHRVQLLCDSIKKRADDAEKSLINASDKLKTLENETDLRLEAEKRVRDAEDRITSLERDWSGVQREVVKLREVVEAKNVELDHQNATNAQYVKDIEVMRNENAQIKSQLDKLHDFEQKTNELLSQTSVNSETIAALQKDLIAEKVYNEKLKSNLEKLGLNLDILDNDINTIIEAMLTHPDVSDVMRNVMCDKQNINNNVNIISPEKIDADKLATLQNDNATLQVDISTLRCQITSLLSQQTALQLANSQLVAEKGDLIKKQRTLENEHKTLLFDQMTLRTLHEQLNSEYERVKSDEEQLKKCVRDLKSELRLIRDGRDNLQVKLSTVETEVTKLRIDSKNLQNLRAEHSKLKDDFRNLFTASERLKIEYRNVQDELKSLKMESRTLRLGHTEMQGELSTRTDRLDLLEVENVRLQQKCDMLFEMNHSLDADRRALMDHVSQLLTQFNSLLTHSLEDKEHYHLEEKLFTDKLNNLCRQKEKLEEKIMEHYRRLDNASNAHKKKGIGAQIVRKVRKVFPPQNRKSWHEEKRPTNSGDSADSDTSLEVKSASEGVVFRRNLGATGSLHAHKPRDEIELRRSQRNSLVAQSRRTSIAGEPPQNNKDTTLGLGSVGSRRTVYLSEDDHPDQHHINTDTRVSSPASQILHASPRSNSPQNNNSMSTSITQNLNTPVSSGPATPMIVYNRVSTVIGGTSGGGDGGNLTTEVVGSTDNNTTTKSSGGNLTAKETAVWYEYGCV